MIEKKTKSPPSNPRKFPKQLRYIAFVSLYILMVVMLSSCWSQKDLGTLAIVLGTALDTGDSPEEIKLTAQVVKASEIGAGSEGGGSGNAYVNVSNTDDSMLAAVRGITRMKSRKLYFAHNKVLVLGSELAKQDTSKILDAFSRDHGTRMNVNVLVARGEASKILDNEVDLEKVPAECIEGMIDNQKSNSEIVVITLRDFSIATLSETTSAVVPIIEVVELDGEKTFRMEGTAVFKEGKMVGELNTNQTRGLLLATGKSKESVTTIETEWGQVILETSSASSNIKAVKGEDGTFTMKLKIGEKAFMQSNETYEDMSTPENLEMLKELLKESIKAEIEDCLKQAQSLSADIFGFGETIQREHPKDWKEIKEDWDKLFSEIKLDIEIDIKLKSTGGLVKPIVPGGAA